MLMAARGILSCPGCWQLRLWRPRTPPVPKPNILWQTFSYPKEINHETDNLPQPARGVRCRDNG